VPCGCKQEMEETTQNIIVLILTKFHYMRFVADLLDNKSSRSCTTSRRVEIKWICCWFSSVYGALLYNLLWICGTACCAACCTANPQQVETSGVWVIRLASGVTLVAVNVQRMLSNDEVLSRTGPFDVSYIVRKRRLGLFRHVARLD